MKKKIPRIMRSKSFIGSVILLAALVIGMQVTGVNTILQQSIIGGYEGGKLYFYGIKTANPYTGLMNVPREIIWHYGDPAPSYANTWQFDGGRFDLDPYSQSDYWQNLIGITDGSGTFERNAFGQVRTDSIDFTEVVSQSSEEVTRRTVKAEIYYAEVDLTLYTHVDEGVFETEKDDPWRSTQIIMNVKVDDYRDLPGSVGNETNWSSLLGVEVVNYEKLQGQNDNVQLNFQAGQMIPMYSEWTDFLNGQKSSSQEGESFVSTVTYQKLAGGQIPVVKSALVSLPFSAFGAEPPNSWSPWREPKLHVTLRIHILKVGSWLVTQKVSEPYKPPITERPEGEPLGGWNPFSWLFPDFGAALNTVMVLIAVTAGAVIMITLVRGGRR